LLFLFSSSSRKKRCGPTLWSGRKNITRMCISSPIRSGQYCLFTNSLAFRLRQPRSTENQSKKTSVTWDPWSVAEWRKKINRLGLEPV
jgi:hypothetical protein